MQVISLSKRPGHWEINWSQGRRWGIGGGWEEGESVLWVSLVDSVFFFFFFFLISEFCWLMGISNYVYILLMFQTLNSNHIRIFRRAAMWDEKLAWGSLEWLLLGIEPQTLLSQWLGLTLYKLSHPPPQLKDYLTVRDIALFFDDVWPLKGFLKHKFLMNFVIPLIHVSGNTW